MAFRFSSGSKSRLSTVHPALQKVVNKALALSEVDFAVIEGIRPPSRQRQLVEAGASKTLKSKHLTGRAVDLAPVIGGRISWDWPPFHKIAAAMKAASAELGIPIVWGGDWRTFKDGPHFELTSATPDA